MTNGHSVCFLNKSKEFNNVQILSINVLLDLIYWTGNHRYNTVMTFLNVFKKVFDTLNIDGHFNVFMCIKHLGKVGVVGHHASVGTHKQKFGGI